MGGAQAVVSPTVRKPKKLRPYSARGETWEVYRTHLDIVSGLNKWAPPETLSQFTSELSADALEFFGSLDVAERDDHDKVMAAMSQRFGTMMNTEAVRGRLESRRQRPQETVEELAADIRTMAYSVYANDTPQRRESEAVRCLMKAIDNEGIVYALIQASPVDSMSRAVEVAVKAREMAQSFLGKPRRSSVRALQAESAPMEQGDADAEWEPDSEEEEAFLCAAFGPQYGGRGRGRGRTFGSGPYRGRQQSTEGTNPSRPCWFCQEDGHWSKECIYRPKNWPDWLRKQISAAAHGQPVDLKPPEVSVPGERGDVRAASGSSDQEKSSGQQAAKKKRSGKGKGGKPKGPQQTSNLPAPDVKASNAAQSAGAGVRSNQSGNA